MAADALTPDTVAQVYADLRGALLGYLRRQVGGDAAVAEDLLHDVMLKALSHGDKPAPDNLAAWLYGVARNTAMDHHRRQRPTEPWSDELDDTLTAEVTDETEAAVQALARCLDPLAQRLPATYRDTVRSSELQGRPLRDVAAAQGISLDAAKQRASRGRRLLRDELLRCCQVALGASGQVLDHDARAVAQCGAAPGGCGGVRGSRD
jgi:RNA polymerase sigma-70 factor (ECF subfamily)